MTTYDGTTCSSMSNTLKDIYGRILGKEDHIEAITLKSVLLMCLKKKESC